MSSSLNYASSVIDESNSLPFNNLNDFELNFQLQNNISTNDPINSSLNTSTSSDPYTTSGNLDYTDPSQIQEHNNINNAFTLLNINIRSSNKNFYKIELLLAQLNFLPTIICITETWLHNTKPLLHSLPGYNFIDKKSNGKAGGVGIFISNSLQFKQITNYELHSTNCEDIWIEVTISNRKKITVGSIYRHPSPDINEFQRNFNKSLELLNKKNKAYVIGGDINIDLLKTSPIITNYKDEIKSHGTIQIVKHATRHSSNSKSSLLDHIYTNTAEDTIKNFCLSYDISDHLPSLSILNSINYNKSNYFKKMIRDTKKFVVDDFLAELSDKFSDFSFERLSANELWNNFETIFNLVLNKHAPLRLQTRSEAKRNKKPWLTKTILKTIKNKHKLYQKVLKDPSESNWSIFKNYRNKLTHTIENSKRLYFQQQIKYTKSNTRKLWKTVNEIVNLKKSKSKNNINIMDSCGKIIKDPKLVSEMVNQYFVSVGENLSQKITQPTNSQITHLSGIKTNNNSMFIKLITEYDMTNYIKNLDSAKSTKSTSVPIKFIKLSSPIITPIITKIFNHCIEEGVFPDNLKTAEIIPVYKKGDKNQACNHRPISLLDPFSKLFEIHLFNQINQFITKYNILHDYQYGFRKDISTDIAVAQITEDLALKMQEGYVTCAVFIDLCKAFDTVNHQILMDKLYKYGIRGIMHKLLTNYLTNRSQITLINQAKSNPKLITCGVPQGSILSTILFNLYINDLPNHSNSTTRLFADDACLCFSAKDSIQLETLTNKELIKTNDYLKINKLTTNYSKSKYIIFTKKRTQHIFNIKMDKHTLDRVNEIKYLGVTLDNKLNWKPHLQSVRLKISQGSYIISKLKHYIDIDVLKMIYYSTVYPHLTYCVTSWGGSPKSNLLPLITLQKRILRIMTNSPYNSTSAPIFSKLKILPMEKIYHFNLAILFHKLHKRKILKPPSLNLLSQTHNYNTRLSKTHNYHQNYNRINLGQQTYSSKGVKIWQKIPTEFKSLPAHLFKKKIKNYFLIHLNTQQ